MHEPCMKLIHRTPRERPLLHSEQSGNLAERKQA
jgi:hypothetical protein